MGEVISCRIPDINVWEEFKQLVLNKYGKLHSVLGKELQKALEEYIDKRKNPSHTHTHKNTDISTDGAYYGIWMRHTISPDDYHRLQVLVGWLRQFKRLKGKFIRGGEIDRIIQKHRWSIPKYRRLLIQYGYIESVENGYLINV